MFQKAVGKSVVSNERELFSSLNFIFTLPICYSKTKKDIEFTDMVDYLKHINNTYTDNSALVKCNHWMWNQMSQSKERLRRQCHIACREVNTLFRHVKGASWTLGTKWCMLTWYFMWPPFSLQYWMNVTRDVLEAVV